MFPCTKCGACCQNISHVKELKEYDIGDGTCKYFDKKNKTCTIYDKRPDICRIDRMFTIKYHKFFTQKQFYVLNAKACNQLQAKHNMDKKFKVIIGG